MRGSCCYCNVLPICRELGHQGSLSLPVCAHAAHAEDSRKKTRERIAHLCEGSRTLVLLDPSLPPRPLHLGDCLNQGAAKSETAHLKMEHSKAGRIPSTPILEVQLRRWRLAEKN